MKRMLINATQQEEVRVALVDGQQLYDLDIESRQRDRLKDSIYKGRIARVEPSLQAAFVEIGEGRQAFLPLKAVSPEYSGLSDTQDAQEKRDIAASLQPDQEIIVQVEKEERGTKGAAVSSYISIAGRYVVLMPNNPRGGGISRRIEGEEREVTKELLGQLDLPSGMGIIIRTGGVGRSVEELQWDLDHLLKLWDSIKDAAQQRSAPALLFRDSDLMGRAIRDYLSRDIGEILVDDEDAFTGAREFVTQIAPNLVNKVKRYDQKVPLFSYFQIESQIESAYRHRVTLPSGGSIVIERTEALVAIDVNSGRSTSGSDIEETALNTNLEAVDEVARQLRLRDIGGLVVLDLIDMGPLKNRRKTEQAMEEALENDRARTQTQRISRFGLLEMTRERLGASLEETSTQLCPRCSGQGRIRDVPSTALSILRLSEEEALKRESSVVRARVPLEVASFLLNEKRGDLAEIEQRTNTHLVIVPSSQFETPHFEIERIRESEVGKVTDVPSYELMETAAPTNDASKPSPRREKRPAEPAVVASQRAPSPTKAKESGPGLLTKVKKGLTSLFNASDEEEETEQVSKRKKARTRQDSAKKQTQRGKGEKSRERKSGRGQARSDTAAKDKDRRRGGGERSGKSQPQAKATSGRRDGQEKARKDAKGGGKPAARGGRRPQSDSRPSESVSAAEETFVAPAEGETKRKPRKPRGKPVTDKARAAAQPESETQAKPPKRAEVGTETAATQQAPEVVAEVAEARVEQGERPMPASESAAPAKTEEVSGDEAKQAAKPKKRRPTKRPDFKAASTLEKFEIETSDVKSESTSSTSAPPQPSAPPENSSVRPSNDPRAKKADSSNKAFEVEEA